MNNGMWRIQAKNVPSRIGTTIFIDKTYNDGISIGTAFEFRGEIGELIKRIEIEINRIENGDIITDCNKLIEARNARNKA